MWENNDSYFVREDALKKLKNAVEEKAKKYNIEIRLLGGLLKFTPTGVYNNVFLELEQPDLENVSVIYKHKNSQLTSDHKGKAVSEKWVVGFLQYHANEAEQLIQKKKKSDELERQSKTEEKPQTSKPHPIVKQPKEEVSYGYSAGKSICPVL
jgi:hypothetical protein